MQNINLSGTLLKDAETGTDKNGKTYVRFTITCGWNDQYNRTQYTHYLCTCYIKGYDSLKKGDQVFVNGEQRATIEYDNSGKAYLNLHVMVFNINRGYRASERAARNK